MLQIRGQTGSYEEEPAGDIGYEQCKCRNDGAEEQVNE